MRRVVMLVGVNESANILYDAIKDDIEVVAVIQEEPISRVSFIKNRIKSLGFFRVFGQILFVLYSKVLCRLSRDRINEILQKSNLKASEFDRNILYKVESINSKKAIELLQKFEYDLIIINATRIISSTVLDSTDKKFINIHAGITPKYRGVHGAYWTLIEDDREHCGVTLHFVDSGIDSGRVISQANIDITTEDNFCTYPYLQLTKGIELLKSFLLEDKINYSRVDNIESKLWYHPTIWEYIYYLVTKGVK